MRLMPLGLTRLSVIRTIMLAGALSIMPAVSHAQNNKPACVTAQQRVADAKTSWEASQAAMANAIQEFNNRRPEGDTPPKPYAETEMGQDITQLLVKRKNDMNSATDYRLALRGLKPTENELLRVWRAVDAEAAAFVVYQAKLAAAKVDCVA